MIEPSPKPRVAFLGTGLIGGPIAARLFEQGLLATGWNRRAAKFIAALQGRIDPSSSPADAVAAADIACLCLTDADAVRAVIEGEQGVLSGVRTQPAPLVVDFTTSSPDDSIALAARYREAVGGAWLDAPVSGGPARALKGDLVIYCGGGAEDFEVARPVLEALSGRFIHVGPQGAGQAIKLCAQLIACPAIVAVAEMLAVAKASGIDPAMLPDLLGGSLADSPILQLFGRHMVGTGDARIGTVSTMLKDVEAAVAMARNQGRPAAVADRAADLLRAMQRDGEGDAQFEALFRRLSDRPDARGPKPGA